MHLDECREQRRTRAFDHSAARTLSFQQAVVYLVLPPGTSRYKALQTP